MRPLGQVNLSHILTGLVTAVILGAGGVIWGLVKPEPKLDQERAIAEALLRKEVQDQRVLLTDHDKALKIALPQLQRIEEAVNDLRETRGVRTASGKRP